MNILISIIFIILAGIIAFLTVKLSNWLQSKEQSAADTTTSVQPTDSSTPSPSPTVRQTGAEIMQEFLTQNACNIDTCETCEDWTYHIFIYQGAYFESYSHNTTDEVLLYYHWGLPYSKDNFAWVQYICNHLSNESKYVKTVYRYDADNDKFDVCLEVGAINPSVRELNIYVQAIFNVARELLTQYQHRDDRTEQDILESMRSRTLFLRCQQYNEPIRIMANYKHLNANCLTIQQLLTSLFDAEQVEDLLSMTVVSENGTKQMAQRDKIANHDLFASIIKKVDDQLQALTSPVSITLDTTFFHYTITLHLVEQTPENIFIRFTAMKVPYDHLQSQMPDQVYTPESVSCLLCYETNSEHSFEAFGQQIQQAREARRNGEQLTDEQQLMLALSEGNIDYQILEGRRLANHGQYLQAIALLEPAYRRLCQKDNTLIQSRHKKAIDTAFHLGRCYYQLNQFNKAYFYIHQAYKANRIDAAYLYFQLLYHTKDFNFVDELSGELDKMNSVLKDMFKQKEVFTEEEQSLYYARRDYYLFLYKLHAEAMIREENYQFAYNDLDYLLQYEETKEYAQARIDQLDQLSSNHTQD